MRIILYILVSLDHPYLKIGISSDPCTRFRVLKRHYGAFDESRTVIIEGEERDIRQLESTLHFIFKAKQVLPLNPRGGASEFFDIECFYDVLLFIWIIYQQDKERFELFNYMYRLADAVEVFSLPMAEILEKVSHVPPYIWFKNIEEEEGAYVIMAGDGDSMSWEVR